MSDFLKKNITTAFYITFYIRMIFLGLVLKICKHTDFNSAKIPFTNLFVFIFLINALNSKNLEQLILFKLFSIFFAVKLLLTLYLRTCLSSVPKLIIFYDYLCVVTLLFDVIVARIVYNIFYIDFMRSMTHALGFSLYRKKLYDARQNLRLGLIMYIIDYLFTEYAFFEINSNNFSDFFTIFYTFFKLAFIILMIILYFDDSLLSISISLFILTSNFLVEISAVIVQYHTNSADTRYSKTVSFFVNYNIEYFFIILYITFYTIKKYVYTNKISGTEK